MGISEITARMVGDKRRWRAYKARSRALPENYRTAILGVERYLMYAGGGSGDPAMMEDLVDLFEQAAAAGTPIRDLVGDEPVEFVEAFVANYPQGNWLLKEQHRLDAAIRRAAGEEPAVDEDRT